MIAAIDDTDELELLPLPESAYDPAEALPLYVNAPFLPRSEADFERLSVQEASA